MGEGGRDVWMGEGGREGARDVWRERERECLEGGRENWTSGK